MALNPNISLQVQTPTFVDPIANYAKVASARNLLMQGQLSQQRLVNEQESLKTHQLANAETERAQDDSAKFQEAYQKSGGDLQKAIPLAIASGVRAGHINKVTDEFNKQVEQVAKTDKEKIAAAAAKLDYLHQTLAPIAAEADPTKQGMLWDAAMQNAVKAGALDQAHVTPYPGPGGVQDELARATTHKDIIAAGVEKRAADEAARKAAKAPSELIKSEQDAVAATQKAAGTEPIQPKDIATMDREKLRDLETAKQHGETNKHEQQRINLEASRNAREGKIFEATYGEGSNPALQGVEPKMRLPAARDAAKVTAEYEKTKGTAADMQTFLDMAKAGNKAAGTNLPLATVGMINAVNGIKRINRAEIAQNEHMGNLYDKVVGFGQGLIVGQPVPANIIDSIGELKTALANNADAAYDRKLEDVDKIYRSNYKSTLKRTGPATAQPSGGKRGTYNPSTGQVEYR